MARTATASQARHLARIQGTGFAAQIIAPARALSLLKAAGFTGTLPTGTLFASYIPKWEQGRIIGGAYCKGPGRSYLYALLPEPTQAFTKATRSIIGHGENGIPSIQMAGPQGLAKGQQQGTKATGAFAPPKAPRKRSGSLTASPARKPAPKAKRAAAQSGTPNTTAKAKPRKHTRSTAKASS